MIIHGSPPCKCFQYFRSCIFFLGTGSHKAGTCNALCEQFKMADNRKLIDVNEHFNKSIHSQRIALLVKNLSGKIVNSCKFIPKAEYVHGNYFSVRLF